MEPTEATLDTRPLIDPKRDPMLALIEKGIDKGMTPDQMEHLINLAERMADRSAKEKFAQALTKFQRICPPIAKTATMQVGSKNVKYAGWDEVGPIVAPYLAECEIAVSFTDIEVVYPVPDSQLPPLMNGACVLTVGSWFQAYPMRGFPVPFDQINKNRENPFAFGSADSYFKRRVFNNAAGIIITDEDNETFLMETLKEHEIKEVLALVKEKGVDIEKFLAWAEAESIDQILRSQYARVIDGLKKSTGRKENGK